MISDICYQQIQGNYWFGAYGDFKVVMMKDCDWVNATKLCQDGGKLFKKWLQNKTSNNLMILLNLIIKKSESENCQVNQNEWRDPSAGIPADVYKCILTGNTSGEDCIISDSNTFTTINSK